MSESTLTHNSSVSVFPLLYSPSRSESVDVADEKPELVGRAFFVGEENRLVANIIEHFLDGDIPSPLVFVGGSGLGKTHLATGLWRLWTQRGHGGRGRSVCWNGTDFVRGLREAGELRTDDVWRRQCREASLVVIDGLEPILANATATAECETLIDESIRRGHRLIVTLSSSPHTIASMPPRLASRLTAGLVLTLAPPSQATREAYLHSLQSLWRYPVPQSLVPTIAERLPLTLPALYGAMLRITTTLSLEQLEQGLEQSANSSNQPSRLLALIETERLGSRPTLDDILRRVARAYRLRQRELLGKSRSRHVSEARGVAVWLSRQLTDTTLQELGRFFGGRDHKTISHLCHATERRCATDPTFAATVEILRTAWR